MADIVSRIDTLLEGATGPDPTVSRDAMRWAPEPGTATPFGEVIDAYSRAQMIADGHLVPVDDSLVQEAGFRFPVALTAAAWDDCVAWTDADNDRQGTVQDETGRLWDVLYMTRLAIRRTPSGAEKVRVRLVRVPRNGRAQSPRPVTLVAACGPDDDGEPVITIMQPGED
jgi:hypothetical protein